MGNARRNKNLDLWNDLFPRYGRIDSPLIGIAMEGGTGLLNMKIQAGY
jgi:hypothetical protein